MPERKDVYALLIIDMQNDFVLPGAPVSVAGAHATIPKIREAIEAFRAAGMPVFHVVREYRENGSDVESVRVERFLGGAKCAVPGTAGAEIVKELEPIPGEYRIVKNRFSAFMNTELDMILRRLAIKDIVVCGTQYPNCIRATAFDGISYDYSVTVLTDASSAQTPQIAEANVLDMKNIGIRCISVRKFLDDLKGASDA
jgi:nicotinamidase-related amidase